MMELEWNYGKNPTTSDTYLVSYVLGTETFTYCLYYSVRKQKWFRTAHEQEVIEGVYIYAWAKMPNPAPLWLDLT